MFSFIEGIGGIGFGLTGIFGSFFYTYFGIVGPFAMFGAAHILILGLNFIFINKAEVETDFRP